jgi:hypothetical protein
MCFFADIIALSFPGVGPDEFGLGLTEAVDPCHNTG